MYMKHDATFFMNELDISLLLANAPYSINIYLNAGCVNAFWHLQAREKCERKKRYRTKNIPRVHMNVMARDVASW